jgi:hypothetical protein
MRRRSCMQQSARWSVVTLMVAALTLSACQGASEESAESRDEAAKVEPLEGTDLSRVTLMAKAADRLGIQTAPVRSGGGEGGESQRTVIPYSAVVYDPKGETWTYTSPKPLSFVRQAITIDRIEGDQAFLLEGPPPGTPVVTVGAAELYGTELGVE